MTGSLHMHSFLCFSKIGFLHNIDLYLGSLSLENCDFDSKQFSLPVAISACRAAPMGANPLGHTFKPLTLYDISIYTIYFSHPMLCVLLELVSKTPMRTCFIIQSPFVYSRFIDLLYAGNEKSQRIFDKNKFFLCSE